MANSKPQLVEFLASGVLGTDAKPLGGGFVSWFYTGPGETAGSMYYDYEMTDPAPSHIPLDNRGCARVYAIGLFTMSLFDKDSNLVQTYYNVYFGFDGSLAGL